MGNEPSGRNIDTLFLEERTYPPPPDFAEQATITRSADESRPVTCRGWPFSIHWITSISSAAGRAASTAPGVVPSARAMRARIVLIFALRRSGAR